MFNELTFYEIFLTNCPGFQKIVRLECYDIFTLDWCRSGTTRYMSFTVVSVQRSYFVFV